MYPIVNKKNQTPLQHFLIFEMNIFVKYETQIRFLMWKPKFYDNSQNKALKALRAGHQMLSNLPFEPDDGGAAAGGHFVIYYFM